jgi:UbiD family decarboxylase
MMNEGYRDLREWLDVVESRGELKRITGADWNLEMSGLTEIVYREGKEPKPALLFDGIPNYPKGYRTLFGMLGSLKRIAITLGYPDDGVDRVGVLQNWKKMNKGFSFIPPKFVATGPLLANSLTGEKIDLLRFPIPRFHELDGGRYIGTCHAVIQKDPETGWVNLGIYRVMLVDKDRLALHILEGKHGRMIMDGKYLGRGKVMPVAVAIGMDPSLWFASLHTVPWGVSEYDCAGGIKGVPIEVVEGPYTGLPLPAHAEIVIEGECHPGELVDEGPFGEWHGYYGNLGLETVPEPVIRVKAIHYRDDPILTCAHPTAPYSDYSLLHAVSNSAGLWDHLEAAGVPGVKDVWNPEIGNGVLLYIVSIKQMYAGHARQAALTASQYRAASVGRYTIVVDDDVDPSNLDEVIWAILTRNDPKQAIQILDRCHSSSADTAISPEEKRKYKVAPKPLTTSNAIIDACRPYEWKAEWYPMARVSPELRTKIFKKWDAVLKKIL